MHPGEEVINERLVFIFLREESSFARMPSGPARSNRTREAVEHRCGTLRCAIGVGIKEWQHRFGKSRKVPVRNCGLVAVRVSPAVVDGTEHGGGIVPVHERARAVVDRFAGERAVVRVHHAMDEADQLPAGNQPRLPFEDRVEEGDTVPANRQAPA